MSDLTINVKYNMMKRNKENAGQIQSERIQTIYGNFIFNKQFML
ncbi:hypothetical protein HDEF_1111 [Candidatus Hamiltonella defensa 5AT (Acyrthosiphon pisum)]|uniref:Uncharacterized protein n=1 Tax=Hamiltonella defensa subsp. Acyrthosiphon pisum (strain 5AT) TaxID=572265 RepID=C4K5E0_HAMD5|nr:hypothetical protein HDEF_1111 [Candidatus Hamiltonella defensa 5AT (Acyrthosiphon pisum)]